MNWRGIAIFGIWIGSGFAVFFGADSNVFLGATISTIVVAITDVFQT